MNEQNPEPPRAWGKRVIHRRRILIVNVFFDQYRRTGGSPYRAPQAMAHCYLAGAFAPELCDVRIYDEVYSGTLCDLELLAWPDMLVLTGLTCAFDRMLQLTAYARALNKRVVVVAGGPAIRALPHLSRRYFDYACGGDTEQLLEVAADVFGAAYVADEIFPRYDLLVGRRFYGSVESSRNCNFNCGFCSLTAENRAYLKYDLDYVRRQILATGHRQILFIDNNFYGNDRHYFLARVDLLKELYDTGRIAGWSALVTGDFFKRPENLTLLRDAGCVGLFSGVESFDTKTLLSHNKRQNTLMPQVELIRSCLESGIVFTYGIIFDPSQRTLDDFHREIEFILNSPEITVPAFFALAIPFPGTPFFNARLKDRVLLPNLRLRDLDGLTVTMQSLDPVDEVAAFVSGLSRLHGYRRQLVRRTCAFVHRYRRCLTPLQLAVAAQNAVMIGTDTFAASPASLFKRRAARTYVCTTELPDRQYRPLMRLPSQYADHFLPTMVTDERGDLADDVVMDIAA